MARKEERAPKSQPTERGGEEAGEREKKEDRRKIFSAHTCTPIHPPTTTPTHYLDEKREGRGNEREGRLSLAHFQHVSEKSSSTEKRRRKGSRK